MPARSQRERSCARPGLPSGITILSVSGWQGEEEPEENPSKEEKQEPGTPMRKAGRPGRKRKHAQVSQRVPGPDGWWWVSPQGCPALWPRWWQTSVPGLLGAALCARVLSQRRSESSWRGCALPTAPSKPSCARWHRPAPCGSARHAFAPSLGSWVPAPPAWGCWAQGTDPPSL